MKKSNLDEMQEQALLRIEHTGCCLVFWGLLAAMAVQGVMGAGIRELAGEWIVFMVLALYLVIGCLHHGIWDPKLKPNAKTNFIVSLLAGMAGSYFFDNRWLGMFIVVPMCALYIYQVYQVQADYRVEHQRKKHKNKYR